MKNNLSFVCSLIFTFSIVGLYQLPTIENTTIKYSINFPINDYFPYSRNFQQKLEDYKISFNSFFDKKNNNNSVIKNQSAFVINSQTLIKDDKTLVNNTTPLENSLPVTVEEKKSCIDNCKVLMLGDSVMGDVSFAFQRLLKKKNPTWEVIDAHKVSSGLSNQNYYNWPATAKKLLEKHKPDYTFVLIGTNDAQGFTHNGHASAFGQNEWRNAYTERIKQMKILLENNSNSWSWIELPIVRDNSFNSRLKIIRDLQKEVTENHFIESQSIFGKHVNNIDMRLRAPDGIHLNSNGSNLLANHLYENINIEKSTKIH